jgi:hypothetical protein
MTQVIDYATAVEMFEQCLDECNPDYKLGYLTFTASRILKEMDPVAYDQDLACYIDNLQDDDIFVGEAE